jgi:hypothetical protein
LKSVKGRERLSTVLAVAGVVLLLIGAFALYARLQLFDSDNFSKTAAKSLREEAVRDELAKPIVEQIINVGPDQLVNVQPLLEGAVSGALETNAFKDVFQDAVRKMHRAMLNKDGDQLVLTIEDANTVIVSAVRSVNPQVAKQIPDDVGQRLVRITNSKAALTATRVADNVRFLGLVLPPLAVLMIIAAIWIAPDRRRALVNSMIGIGAAGAVGFIVLLVARTLLLRKFGDEGLHDAVADIYDLYMGGLTDWFLLGGVIAIALAAAAAARDPDPLDRPKQVLAWFGRAPESAWTRAARALAVGFAGIVAFLEPTLALQVAAVLLGAVAIYFAVVELIASISPAAVAPKRGAKGKPPPAASWRTPALAGATIVAVAVVVALLVTNEDKAHEVVRPAGPVKNCNGYAKLCDRTLPEVAFPGAHNAMSAAELPGWYTPNQRRAIPRQLDEGVRAFLIDSHYGIKRKNGPVLTDLDREGTSKVLESVNEQLGPEAAQRFQQLQRRYAKRGGQGKPGSYFCHIVCELGSTPMTEELTWFKDFLDTHPDEVVVLFIEDKVNPEDTAKAFEESGLLRYAYVHRPGTPYPTLRSMIESDKRLFVMAEVDSGRGKYPWYHHGFNDIAQETPYTFNSVEELEDLDYSCRQNRGRPSNPMFQLNNWVEKLPRSPATAAKVNAFEFLKQRARECERRRGLLSNLIAVDYYDKGDLQEVARVLNGIPRDGKPSYRQTGD